MQAITPASVLPIKAVVYATDFYPSAENAGCYASLLAEQFSATLLVCHAFYLSQAALEAEVDRPMRSRQRKDLKAELAEIALRLGRDRIESVPILVAGNPQKQIPKIAEENAPSMIVLGTHGAGWAERGVFGSVAEGILRSTYRPSLTVGPLVPALDCQASPFHRVLYATELDPTVAHAAAYAVAFAEAFHTKIDVLHVIQPEELEHPGCFQEITKQYYTALDNIVPKQARDFCHPRSFVEAGRAYELILQHIQEFSTDLLVLGIRHTSHVWTRSRTSGVFQIIANAPCPVMTVLG
jgi:nucleotide-binding universal stress UspA family protein